MPIVTNFLLIVKVYKFIHFNCFESFIKILYFKTTVVKIIELTQVIIVYIYKICSLVKKCVTII